MKRARLQRSGPLPAFPDFFFAALLHTHRHVRRSAVPLSLLKVVHTICKQPRLLLIFFQRYDMELNSSNVFRDLVGSRGMRDALVGKKLQAFSLCSPPLHPFADY